MKSRATPSGDRQVPQAAQAAQAARGGQLASGAQDLFETKRAFTPQDPAAHRRWRRRLRLFQIGLLLFFAAVGMRLVQIQIFESGKFTGLAEKQYRRTKDKPALRGSLLDRNNLPIVTSTSYVSIEADPVNVAGDAAALAKSLSSITGRPRSYYISLLARRKDGTLPAGTKSGKGSRAAITAKTAPSKAAKSAKSPRAKDATAAKNLVRFVVLEKSLDPGPVFANRIDTLNGVTIRWQSGRIYHSEFVAGQLLGMTAQGDSGIAGIELGYDSVLRGTDGYMMYQKDGTGRFRPAVEYPSVDPVPGNSLELTLDLHLQEVAENELQKGVKGYEAEGGVVVMLQPRTGEVLALAQYPRVNPAEFGDAAKEDQKLRAVTDMVEPGSVFKIVTVAAALDDGLVRPDRMFNGGNGRYLVNYKGVRKPREIKDVHKLGVVSFRTAVEHSSNIIMAQASDIIGNERLYRMARNFGFGMRTGIDVPAEIGGILKNPTQWSLPTRHSLSFGYEVGATPIQIAAAYAAIANHGVLMRPFLLRREIAPDGTVIRETVPSPVRQVISEETASIMGEFLEGVVERGTATAARIEGVRIAGKTGTSKRLVNGKYADGKYTASFVGYFPAEDPKVVCLVMLDNPSGISYYGGTTSGPIFREIVSRIISSEAEFARPAPLPVAQSGAAAPANVPAGRADEEVRPGEGDAKAKSSTAARRLVPDVRGYSIRKALNLLRDEKFQPVVDGSGVVVSQSPAPGEPATANRVIRLTCAPREVGRAGAR